MSNRGWLSAYAGRTVVVIASGPSLTAADCEAVRASGLPTFVTNTTFRMAPWADVLLAHDAKWWQIHGAEAADVFQGKRFRCGGAIRLIGEKTPARELLQFRSFGNTGCAAISLAALAGAKRVILLGVDCQRTAGATHWHGDHPAELSNAKTMDRWPHKFEKVAAFARSKGCEVVNASRATALTCFRLADLGDVLAAEREQNAAPQGGAHETCDSGGGAAGRLCHGDVERRRDGGDRLGSGRPVA